MTTQSNVPWSPRFDTIKVCPLCGNSRTIPLKPFLRTFVRGCDQIVESRFNACTACNFGFQSRLFDRATWGKYYANNYQMRRGSIAYEETVHLKGQSDFIGANHLISRDADILEVGADNGSCLFLLTKEFGGRGYYDEFNLDSRKILDGLGFQNSERFPKKKYDLIVLRHVFEHIPRPISYLEQLKSRLGKGGAVFIEVPDCSYLSSPYVDILQIEHVNYFSLQSICIASAKAGFIIKAVQFARTPNYATSPNRVLRVLLELENAAPIRNNSAQDWKALPALGREDGAAFARFFKANRGRRLAIYGAGTKLMHFLANAGTSFHDVSIYDMDPQKIGTSINGAVVLDPRQIGPDSFDVVLLTVVGYQAEVLRFLAEKGVPRRKVQLLPKETKSNE